MAINGKVDIIASDLTLTYARNRDLHFTTPFMSSKATVLLKKEKRQGGRGGSVCITL